MSKTTKPNRPAKPEQDDDVEELADLISHMEVSDLYHNSYLSRSCIRNLKKGITKKPQHMTMTGIAAAAGFEYVLRRRTTRK